MSRREFLKVTGLASVAAALGIGVVEPAVEQEIVFRLDDVGKVSTGERVVLMDGWIG